MNNPLKALYLLLTSLGLALIFNFLFFGKALGISVFIFVLVLLAEVYLFGKYQKVPMAKSLWLVALIGFFSLMPSLHDNGFLTFLNICAALGLLMLFAHDLLDMPAYLMKIVDYFLLVVVVPFKMFARSVRTLLALGEVHSSVKYREVWIRVVKGILMAIPLLIIFAILFSQADLAFSQFAKSFVDIHVSERSMQYTVLFIFAFIAGLSYLSYIFFPSKPKPEASDNAGATVTFDKRIEMSVFLSLISALFLLFIVFQITYLFGGESNIVNAGFTYAEYARRGFWELLAVALISLAMLLFAEKYSGAENKHDNFFMIPSLVLVVEVLVVIVSAYKRLSLYIDTYGMTELRFYVVGFIAVLFVLFVLLAVKFIEAKSEQFYTFGILLTVVIFLVAINVVNPDAYIVSANIKQYNKTGKIDINYVGNLSADATSQKLELYKQLKGEDKKLLLDHLQYQKTYLENDVRNWQSANLSRYRALRLINSWPNN
jgi:hypothetical protein